MKIRRNLSKLLLRREIIGRSSKSIGTSIGTTIWQRFRLFTGLVFCSACTLLPLSIVMVSPVSGAGRVELEDQEAFTADESATSSCIPPAAGLVSWWAGDKDPRDLQGNNVGILKGGATYAAGYVSSGFSFDGSLGQYVQVGDTPSLKMTTAATFECWIYPTADQESIFVNREGEYLVGGESDGEVCWGFANTDPGWVGICTGFVAPLASWTHVAVTYDNGLITTYGNGVQVHQYQGSGPIGDVLPTLNDFRIGNRQQFPAPFTGIIDELKVYNRALSSSEVAAIYAAGSSGNCKPVVFVQDISPYAVPKTGGVYKVGTTLKIVDALGHSMSRAGIRLTVTLPEGGSFTDKVTTGSDGNADFSIFSSTLGTYVFEVERVTKLGRNYSAASNIETQDQITIP
jgi:hypothetical protein